MRHEEYKKLLALEAVGALEAGERARLSEHLSSCAECGEELRELSEAAAALAYTVEPVVPPAALRASVLARARASGQPKVFVAPPEVLVDRSEAVDAERGAGRTAAPGREARGLLSGMSLWQILTGRPALGFGAALAAAAVVLLGLTNLALWGRYQSLRVEAAQLYRQLRETQGELAGQREQLASARDVNDLLASPGTRVAELAGKEPAPQARAMLAYDRTSGRAVMMATGLPPAPAGHAYQLWLIAGNKPLPGGTFHADAEGRARMTDRLPAGVGNPTFAVTLEREGGETAPKGDMYLLGAAS